MTENSIEIVAWFNACCFGNLTRKYGSPILSFHPPLIQLTPLTFKIDVLHSEWGGGQNWETLEGKGELKVFTFHSGSTCTLQWISMDLCNNLHLIQVQGEKGVRWLFAEGIGSSMCLLIQGVMKEMDPMTMMHA